MKSFSRREVVIALCDFLIALFAFWFARYFGDLPRWYWLVLSAFLWVIFGIITRKLQFDSYKRIRYALSGILLQGILSGLFLFLLYRKCVPGYEFDHSILLATGLIMLLEWGLYGLLRKLVYRKIPYFYEEPPLNDVTEIGLKSGDGLQNTVWDKDIDCLFTLARNVSADGEDIVRRLKENKNAFSENTLLIDTSDPENILAHKIRSPRLVVHLRSLNRIRHINTLFSYTNYCLPEGGFIACHCVTAALRREKVLRQSPPVINHLLYALDYCWHRLSPKLSLTRGFYFWTTGGKLRALTRVEVLGRLYRAGFDVLYEEVSNGRFYAIASKIKAPIRDDKPSTGPLIRLRRHGKGGEIIGVYKFRTMHAYSEYLQSYIYRQEGLSAGGKIAYDYRVTPAGRFLRKTWLDELPMFINWVKGDLKLVGVRPLSSHYFHLYDKELQELRIKTKPGLLPPFYADMPKTLEEIQESERRYLTAYLKNPVRTDWQYFWKAVRNIVLKGKRSG